MQDQAGASLIATDSTDAAAAERPAPRRQLFAILVVAAALTLLADQLTKIWALHTLTPGEPKQLVGSLIQLNLIRNAGAAFSIGRDATWVLTMIAGAVLIFVGVTARRLGSLPWAWALGLLLGGSLGNLTDRVLRPPGPGRGSVVDFIDYFGLFIGNVADIAIVVAAAVVALLATRGIGVDGSLPHHGRHEGAIESEHESAADDAAGSAADLGPGSSPESAADQSAQGDSDD